MIPACKITRRVLTLILLSALALTAQGCGVSGPERTAPGGQAGEPFVPATLEATEAAEPTITPPVLTETAGPTEAVDCESNLSFLSDLTIPDGTVVYPGAVLDKRWEVSNSGTCSWGEGYSLRLTAGDNLQANPEQALFPARGGSQTTIQITFQAPPEPGIYRSAWQAFDPDGEPFGDPIYIEIEVAAPLEGTPPQP
ncbi:MAG TPA: NBR1-Ig-like domain-containing protein [Anaerolineaceae bacterium]|nr:NBR1-Ig-like domain-containing protein [Anaerolineaceae bacterium]